MAKCAACLVLDEATGCGGCVFQDYFKTAESLDFLKVLCSRYPKQLVQDTLELYHVSGVSYNGRLWIEEKAADFQKSHSQDRDIAALNSRFEQLSESFDQLRIQIDREFNVMNTHVSTLIENNNQLRSTVDLLEKDRDNLIDVCCQIIHACNVRIVGHGYPYDADPDADDLHDVDGGLNHDVDGTDGLNNGDDLDGGHVDGTDSSERDE